MSGKRKKHYGALAFLSTLALLIAVVTVSAQMASENFRMRASVLDEGGGRRAAAHFETRDAIGQPTGGVLRSVSFGLYAGFIAGTMEEFPLWVPCIRLSSDVLDFGEVRVGRSSDRTMTVYNDGAGALQVTWITTDDPQFTCDPRSASIGGGGMALVTVSFTPAAEGEITATLLILSDDAEHPELGVELLGVGVAGCAGGDVGDVNGDASINVLDVLTVVNDILGIIPLDEEGTCRADCNSDEDINVLDALGIVNVILGIFTECPGGPSKIQIHPEAMKFLETLEPYFTPEDFEKFIRLVREVRSPDEYSLSQNYPNPFNPTTTINFQIPMTKSQTHITLKIYNTLGQEVVTLVDEEKGPGYYTVTWDGSDAASGVYFYRLVAGEFTAAKRMVLLK